jgi:hypothetical protein
VVAIMALVSSGVGVAAFKYWVDAQRDTAETNARNLRGVVQTWWRAHGSAICPALEDLIADGALDKDSPRRDPWGGAWRIECSNDDVTIISEGRDRSPGTDDDIRIPPT